MSDLENLDKELNLIIEGQEVDKKSDLAKTALYLSQLNAIKPEASYRQKAKAQLLAKAKELKIEKEKSAAWFWLKPKRWLVASSLAFLLSSSSVVYAANGAMPDSWLYPIKQLTEKIAVSLPLGQQLTTRIKLGIAKRRLAEARYLEKRKQHKKAKVFYKNFRHLWKEVQNSHKSTVPNSKRVKNEAKQKLAPKKINPRVNKIKPQKTPRLPNKQIKPLQRTPGAKTPF